MNGLTISDEAKARIGGFSLPSYREIPDIGLFLEQTTKFVSECVRPLEGAGVTGSMISNYVKKKLIANPVKKQYYRDQIADAIFIVLVKSVLSLEETEKMLRLQRESFDSQSAYEYFRGELTNVLQSVFGLTSELPEVSGDDTAVKELLRRVITAVAHKVWLNEALSQVE